LKGEIRRRLYEEHMIWRGSLYPDSAGAAKTVQFELTQKQVGKSSCH
jgi:hypothetical protein